MLQRIQTLFIVIAIIAIGLTFVFPVTSLSAGDAKAIYTNYGLKSIDAKGNAKIIEAGYIYIAGAINLIVLLYTIFQYKNRKWQMKLCRVAYLLIIVQMGLYFFMPDAAMANMKLAGEVKMDGYGLAFYFPLVALAFVFLAEYFIKRDEQLVRSADRLR